MSGCQDVALYEAQSGLHGLRGEWRRGWKQLEHASDVKRGQNLEAEAEAKNNYEKRTK